MPFDEEAQILRARMTNLEKLVQSLESRLNTVEKIQEPCRSFCNIYQPELFVESASMRDIAAGGSGYGVPK